MQTQDNEAATETAEAPPLPVVAAPEEERSEPAEKKPKGDGKGDKGDKRHYVPIAERGDSAVRRALQQTENKTLRELIEAFGNEGGYQVHITRKEPEEATDASGKLVKCAGFIRSFENPTKPIDEEYIKSHYGGGTYEVKFKERKPGGSGWMFAGQRTVHIAGHPVIESNAAAAPAAAPANPNENPSIVKETLGFMKEVVNRAEERANNRGDDAVVTLLREQLRDQNRQIADLQREIREGKAPAPQTHEDKAKDKLLDKLIDGDSARLNAVRAQYESEIRAIKDHNLENERRLRDQADRDRQELRISHERELATVKQSCEMQITIAKQSYETQLVAHKAASETQVALLKSENQKLTSENARLHDEVKELRAKKDKSIVEIAKELKTVKEALGEDEAEDSSPLSKLAEIATTPEAWQGIASLVRGPAPVAPQVEAPKAKPDRQIVTVEGKKMLLVNGKLYPAKRKKESEAPAEGTSTDGEGTAPTEPQMPNIDPAILASTVQFLTSAFEGGQDAEIVAQGVRSRVPEDLLNAIRDHGVDQVMTKMAKLSSTSPLSSQAGRNWVRKLGKALVGE